MMFNKSYLPIIAGLILVIAEARPMMALSPQEVGQVVKPSIVRIVTTKGSASGTIIKQQGQKYTVLTTSRIVAGQSQISIVTSDGKKHTAIATSDRIPSQGLELAVLRFSSNQTYKAAAIADTISLSISDNSSNIFIAGYPQATRTITAPVYSLRSGNTQKKLTSTLKGGYTLVYKANLLPGMEGGGIFDNNGVMIGVNGYSVSKTDRPDAINSTISFQEGSYVGISISAFTALASSRSSGDYTPPPSSGGVPSVTDMQATAGKVADTMLLLDAEQNLQSGRYRQALEGYDSYVKKYPKQGLGYGHRGNAKFTMGDKRGAIADYDVAFKLDPTLVQVLKNRAIAKSSLGDKAGALQDAERAVQIKPNDPEYVYLLGIAYYENGRKADAIKQLQQAAILYQQQGNVSEAKKTAAIIKQLQEGR
jgi:serine protease Do